MGDQNLRTGGPAERPAPARRRGVESHVFPQVGPGGCRGDERPVVRGHLPVVRGDAGGGQDPAEGAQDKAQALCRRAPHCECPGVT